MKNTGVFGCICRIIVALIVEKPYHEDAPNGQKSEKRTSIDPADSLERSNKFEKDATKNQVIFTIEHFSQILLLLNCVILFDIASATRCIIFITKIRRTGTTRRNRVRLFPLLMLYARGIRYISFTENLRSHRRLARFFSRVKYSCSALIFLREFGFNFIIADVVQWHSSQGAAVTRPSMQRCHRARCRFASRSTRDSRVLRFRSDSRRTRVVNLVGRNFCNVCSQ